MSGNQFTVSRMGYVPAIRVGTQKICDLPDDGPWSLRFFKGRFLAASAISGLYELVDDRLERIPPFFEEPKP